MDLLDHDEPSTRDHIIHSGLMRFLLLDAAELQEDIQRGPGLHAGGLPISARDPLDRVPENISLREALRKVVIAGVTVNADAREPNEVYHLLNRELKPLCGAGEVEGRFVTAVTAPWVLRCKRIGCAPHWRYITEPNEVITTKTGDRYHYNVDCSAFKVGPPEHPARQLPPSRCRPDVGLRSRQGR